MYIDAFLLQPGVMLLSAAAAGLILLWAALSAPWRALAAQSSRVHAAGGSLVLLIFLHVSSIDVVQGLSIHLLGVTTVTLLLGLRFALLLGAVAVVVAALMSDSAIAAAPLSWCLGVAAPALATRWLVYWLRTHSMRHPFVYIMGAGFAGGILTALVTAGLGLLVLALIGQGVWVETSVQNWPVLLLVAFPEGFINGTLITAFVVLAPDTLRHFDSEFYFL